MAAQDAESWTPGRKFSWKKLALALESVGGPAAALELSNLMEELRWRAEEDPTFSPLQHAEAQMPLALQYSCSVFEVGGFDPFGPFWPLGD